MSTPAAAASALPDDLLLHVFHGLSLHERILTLPRVCPAWRALASEARSWLYVRVDRARAPHFEPFQLTYVCARFEHVVSMDLTGCQLLCDRSMALMLHHAPCLTALDLSHCDQLTDGTLRALATARAAPHLRVFRMHRNEHVSQVGVSALAAACPQLETLELDECEEVGDAALCAIARHCPLLRELSIRSCREVAGAGVSAIVGSCTKLERMDLGGLEQMSPFALSAIGRASLRHLHQLSISHCPLATDASIADLVAGCSALQRLDLTACFGLSSTAVLHVAAHCPRLVDLSLGWLHALSDVALAALAKGCPNLLRLNLTKCTKLTDASLMSLAAHCRQLTSLDVSHVYQLSDVGVQQLASSLTNLRDFACEGCYRVRASALANLSSGCRIIDADGAVVIPRTRR